MSLKFSVITPSFRQGCFIERTINSVLSQNIDDIDYIVCDGGSEDETIEILKKYDQDLRWISEKDRGQADAVNKGISMTTGDIIAWINSDDVYYSGAFHAVKQIFEDNPEIEAVFGEADFIDEFDNIIGEYPTEKWNYKRLIEVCCLCQPAVFFRRSLVEKFGNLDISLDMCMDYELWLRYGSNIYFYHLPQKLAGSRMYASNKSMSKKTQAYYETIQMHKQKFGVSPENWIMVYAFLKAEESTGISRFDNKNIKKLVLSSFVEILKFNKFVSPKMALKIIIWLLFPDLAWFRKTKFLAEMKNNEKSETSS